MSIHFLFRNKNTIFAAAFREKASGITN